jgi:ribonuclease-3
MRHSFEAILGHEFRRPELLQEALTHRSAAQGRGVQGGGVQGRGVEGRARNHASNERLEFIGDRVLGLTIAEWLAERFPREQEGELGRRLAYLVSQPVLAVVADTAGIAAALAVSPGEAKAGVAKRATVLADALEAALGALYLDGGLDVARDFIRRAWNDAMIEQADPPKDAKTALQEWAQKRGKDLPVYEVTDRSGPAHAPAFTVTVRVGAAEGIGTAGSKRAAEQLAAEALLLRLSA